MNFRISVLFLLLAPTLNSVSAAEFSWKESGEGQLDLLYGDAPVLRYMHRFDRSSDQQIHDTYKVFHQVFAPDNGAIITKGPGGKYTHHRGLYVGWNKTQTKDGSYDFWHCKAGAHLRDAGKTATTVDGDSASMTAEIHWNDKDGRPVIIEMRTVTVRAIEVGGSTAWQIDWSTKLASQRGEIALRGDRQHAGFQFRAAQEVADANSARYVRPQDFTQQEEAFQTGDKGDPPAHIDLNWFCMHYPLHDSHYNVEYFEAPGQPHPSLYSERPYGRFGAFYKADLKADEPLEMTYRVVVSAGETPQRDAIQARYDAYVAELAK